MSNFEIGKLCQVAGAAVGTYFCPGVGTAIGSMAGKAIGDAVDGKNSDYNVQPSSDGENLDIGYALANFSNLSNLSDSENALDLSKKFLFS